MSRLLCSVLIICATATSCNLWIRSSDNWIDDTSVVVHGIDTTLKSGFPDSIISNLVFPDAELTMSMVDNTAEDPRGLFIFETEEPIDSVLVFYDKIPFETDWTVTSSMESTENDVRSVMYNFTGGDSSTALVTVQHEEGKNYITITYGEN